MAKERYECGASGDRRPSGRRTEETEAHMHAIIYLVGLVVIVLAIVNFVF